MKKYVELILIMLVISSFGCAGMQAVNSPEEQPVSLQAEATAAGDNQTKSQQKKEAPKGIEAAKEVPSKQPPALPPLEARAPDTPPAKSEKNINEKGSIKTDNETGGKISLNFDNADIYEVINALSDFLGISYIIDPAVKGKVNIHTTGEVDKAQLLPIVETIFEMNNIAIVKFGDLYKIVPIKDAQKEIMDVNIGRDIEEPESYDKVIIQIVPLKYVPSSEVIKALKPFTGKGGEVIDYPKSNIIILVETAANIQKLLRIIDIIDIDAFEQTSIRFFKAKNADVTDLAKELENIFTSFGIEKTTAKGIGLSVIPIERASCVVAVSSIPGILDKVQHWVEVLDTVDRDTDEQIFIYFVENGKAGDIADLLIQLYGGESRSGSKTASKESKSKSSSSSSSKSRSRRSRMGETDRSSARTKTPADKTTGKTSGLLEGNIMIVTDESTNAIIVKTTPLDYANIKDTIKRLDIIPRQVLIEVMIAEVALSGDTAFGIEWALLGSKASIGGYQGSDRAGVDLGLGGIGNTDITKSIAKGFTYAFDSTRLQAFLFAQASNNKLSILASPHILAADNKEARIEVGEEVPIVTSEYIPTDVQTNTSTSRSIEYRSTGIILTVTPRINEQGLVSMEISQEVSEAQPVVAGGIQSPVISNRKAETSLVVQHGGTIVIGGLIKDRAGKTSTGVPFLAQIPLVNYLFSSIKTDSKKTELVIMITPHVVKTLDEATLTTQEFQQKMDMVRKLINKSGDTWVKGYK